jgi:hypothetical protein
MLSYHTRRGKHLALAHELVDFIHEDYCLLDLLDDLATAGIRLAPLEAGDFDRKGVSLASRAYLEELR